jgi:RNA polymerase sigma-70 factor (sigma-E family)
VRAAERDAAFSEFVRARRTHLRRIAYAVCGDWDRADDLVQTALVKLYVAWPRVRRDGREEAYARTVIVRAHIDETRRPWRRERPDGDDHDRPAPAPLAVEERDALFEALQALPAMQRKAVLLRHWLGLSVAETAAELDVAEGTVKSHTSRGLAALQAVLEASDA